MFLRPLEALRDSSSGFQGGVLFISSGSSCVRLLERISNNKLPPKALQSTIFCKEHCAFVCNPCQVRFNAEDDRSQHPMLCGSDLLHLAAHCTIQDLSLNNSATRTVLFTAGDVLVLRQVTCTTCRPCAQPKGARQYAAIKEGILMVCRQ